ncbi:hypothetical protein AL058_13505 [Pseudomonas savastanoi pv. nerii]|nr:hypothetical protein AL058_13505 [Pseudomonas savastanoi pv. nerii]PAB34676.1 hypothetical protein CC202_07430 [Pseudomonas savastanoi]
MGKRLAYRFTDRGKFRFRRKVAAVVFSKNKLSDVIQRHQLHFMAEIGQKHFGVPQNTQVTVCQGVI